VVSSIVPKEEVPGEVKKVYITISEMS